MSSIEESKEKKINDNGPDTVTSEIDLEGGSPADTASSTDDRPPPDQITKAFAKAWKLITNRLLVHVVIGLLFTAWWISIIVQDKHRHKWLIPTFIWGFVVARLITWHTKYHYTIFGLIAKIWNYGISIRDKLIPEKFRLLAGTAVVIATVLVGTFVPEETVDSKKSDRAISFFGCLVFIFFVWLSSENKNAINWYTVNTGMLMQFIVAVFVLRTSAGYDFFNFISTLARELLGFAKQGVAFLTNTETSKMGMFFFTVLPAVIFFVAVVHIWYYWGLVQWSISRASYFFIWATETSGAESAVAVASPFIGQGESAILINSLLPYVTRSELHVIMTSGFATISGSVLAGYISLGLNPQALVSSCIMSIPCSLALSKLRIPETERSISHGKAMTSEQLESNSKHHSNVIEAFADGATLGIQIALTILTNCLCIIALVALINGLLTYFGKFWNIGELTLTLILGYIMYPVAWLIGTPKEDVLNVARLIAIKVIQNEYVGYATLTSTEPYVSMSRRTKLIATYCLCGFANFGSVGTTVGVLKTLAPEKTKQISSLVMSALVTGCTATLLSAAIAAMVINDLSGFETSMAISS